MNLELAGKSAVVFGSPQGIGRVAALELARAGALRIGDPLDEATTFGAIVSKDHFEVDLSCIQLATEEDGTIACGGEPAPPPNARCAEGWAAAAHPSAPACLPLAARTRGISSARW